MNDKDTVVVPRVLTDEMLTAVVKLDFEATHDPLWPEYWAALLAAVPSTSVREEVEDAYERAAKVAEDWASSLRPGSSDRHAGHLEARREIAAAIRALNPSTDKGGEK